MDKKAGRISENYGLNSVFSLASIALILQMGLTYFFSALHKNHPIWNVHETAIHYALHIDAYDTFFGQWLRQYPSLTTALTRGTYYFEFSSPWFLIGFGVLSLLPTFGDFFAYQGAVRTVAVTAFIAFHLGLGLSMSLGTFAWFAALLWVGIFPSWAWDHLNGWRGRMASREKSSGPLYLLSSGLNSIADWIQPKAQHFSTHQGRFKGVQVALEWVKQWSAGILILYVLLINAGTVDREYLKDINGKTEYFPDAKPAIDLLRLDQHWGLFAPYPRTSDGYYVVLGKTNDNLSIDFLSSDNRLTWEKPEDVSGSYKTFRSRKYFRNIRRSSKAKHLRLYSSYVCRIWSETHQSSKQLQQVSIYFMRRRTLLSGGHEAAQKEFLSTYNCDAFRP